MRLYLKSCGEMTGEGARPDYARPSSRPGSLALSNLEPGRAIAKRRRPRAPRGRVLTQGSTFVRGYKTYLASRTKDRGNAIPPDVGAANARRNSKKNEL
jgi:hypothetical protein